MRNLKKVLVLMVVSIIAIGLVGCGKDNSQNKKLYDFFITNEKIFDIEYKFIAKDTVAIKITAEKEVLVGKGEDARKFALNSATDDYDFSANGYFKTDDKRMITNKTYADVYFDESVNVDLHWDMGESLYIIYRIDMIDKNFDFTDLDYAVLDINPFKGQEASITFRFNESKADINKDNIGVTERNPYYFEVDKEILSDLPERYTTLEHNPFTNASSKKSHREKMKLCVEEIWDKEQ